MSIIKALINRIKNLSPPKKLRYLVHVLVWIPLVVITVNFAQGQLTANPIQAAIQRTGITAITLLALSLSVTPANIIFRCPVIRPLRRTFGLYAFLYALIHVLLYIVVDYGLNISLILDSIAGKQYILAGGIGFLILLIMAVTSIKVMIKKLGKNWKKIHVFVYPASLILGLHFAWALKGDLFRFSGDIFWPVVYLSCVIILLLIRVPMINKTIQNTSLQPIHSIQPAISDEKDS